MYKDYRLTDHAREELQRRKIPLDAVERLLSDPEQTIAVSGSRHILQSKIEISGKLYLVRVVVDLTDPLMVVTAYRTSKIKKYWVEEDDDESNL